MSAGFDCNVRRTPNSGGLSIKGDIIDLSGPLKGWSFECKRQEKLNIWNAIAQAKRDARHKKWAVVFSRNNEGRDYVCIDMVDFIELMILKESRNEREV